MTRLPKRGGRRASSPTRGNRPPTRGGRPLRRARPSPFRRVLTVIAVVAGAGMMVALSTAYARSYTLARQAAGVEQHRRELVAQNARLREEIERLQTDDRYIEQLARQQLGLVRPGEIELLIVPSGGAPQQSGGATMSSSRNAAPAAARTAAGDAPGSSGARAAARPWTERIQDAMKRLFGWPWRYAPR